MGFLKRLINLLQSPTHSRTMGILVLLLILAAVPLTVVISQKQQEIRQRAESDELTTCKNRCYELELDAPEYNIDTCLAACDQQSLTVTPTPEAKESVPLPLATTYELRPGASERQGNCSVTFDWSTSYSSLKGGPPYSITYTEGEFRNRFPSTGTFYLSDPSIRSYTFDNIPPGDYTVEICDRRGPNLNIRDIGGRCLSMNMSAECPREVRIPPTPINLCAYYDCPPCRSGEACLQDPSYSRKNCTCLPAPPTPTPTPKESDQGCPTHKTCSLCINDTNCAWAGSKDTPSSFCTYRQERTSCPRSFSEWYYRSCDVNECALPTPPPTSLPTATPEPAVPTDIPAPARLAADVDGSGCIDIRDFNIWQIAARTGQVREGTYPDINKDGQIDIRDFNDWQRAMRKGENLCK